MSSQKTKNGLGDNLALVNEIYIWAFIRPLIVVRTDHFGSSLTGETGLFGVGLREEGWGTAGECLYLLGLLHLECPETIMA